MPPVLIMVLEELGLPCGNVHIGGALGFAGLAGEAEVQRVMNLLVLPAVADNAAFQHLPQQVRAAARGVLLLTRCHVAGTHGGIALFAAEADADAARGGLTEGTGIGNVLEPGIDLAGARSGVWRRFSMGS